jgi:hypothetical protein
MITFIVFKNPSHLVCLAKLLESSALVSGHGQGMLLRRASTLLPHMTWTSFSKSLFQ